MPARHLRPPFSTTTICSVIALVALAAAPAGAQIDLVKDINPNGRALWDFAPASLDSSIFFSADDGVHGNELWISDGTTDGTRMVRDIWPDEEGSDPAHLVAVGDLVYFFASTALDQYGYKIFTLWRSDGTFEGTYDLGIAHGSYWTSPVEMGGSLYLPGWDVTHGDELWKVTGDTAVLLKDIEPGVDGSYPLRLTAIHFASLGERLVFSAETTVDGNEPWISDGTSEGTVLLKDINTVSVDSNASLFTEFAGRAYFGAEDGIHGWEIWVTDGTEAGTERFEDSQASGYSQPTTLTVTGEQLFFVATDPIHGQSLWVTDGTAGNSSTVHPLQILNDGLGVSWSGLTAFDGEVYFLETSGSSGTELWVSDGTVFGTGLVKDVLPGVESSNIRHLAVGGDLLFFNADDGIHGTELWLSDGTETGTLLVHDLIRGGNANPDGMTPHGDRLFFCANSPSNAGVLFSLPLSDIITTPDTPTGVTEGDTESTYEYSIGGAVSVRGNTIEYKFNWGDGSSSDWLPAGVTAAEKSWDTADRYEVTAEARSGVGSSNRSAPLDVHMLFTESVSADVAGPETGYLGTEYEFAITGESSYGHDMEVMVEWGDQQTSSWTPLDTDTDSVVLSHTWSAVDEYEIFVTVRCIEHDDRSHRINRWMSIGHEDIAEPVIDGPTGGDTGESLGFTFSGESSAGHDLEYTLHWGDDTDPIDWTPFGEGAFSTQLSHTYANEGMYTIQLGVRCAAHHEYENWTTQDVTIAAEEVSVVSIDGPSEGDLEQSYQFTLTGSSSHGHDLQYSVEWGEDQFTDWTDFGSGVTSAQLSHAWSSPGEHVIQFGVRCAQHDIQDWQEHRITIADERIVDVSISGPSSAEIGESQEFTITGRSTADHLVEFSVAWGDGEESPFETIDQQTDTATISHAWTGAGEKTVTLTVRCSEHGHVSESAQTTITITEPPPETIDGLSIMGPDQGQIGQELEFTVSATSSEGHDLVYSVDWNDGSQAVWLPIDNGTDTATTTHTWGEVGEKTVTVTVRCAEHTDVSDVAQTTVTITDQVVETIDTHTLTGPTEGEVGEALEFTVSATSSEGHDLVYIFDWDDDTETDWEDLDNVTDTAVVTHTWSAPGIYIVEVLVACPEHEWANSVRELTVAVGVIFADDFEDGDCEMWSSTAGEVEP